MNFHSKIWHTNSDDLPIAYKCIVVLYVDEVLNPDIMFFNEEDNDFRSSSDVSDITPVDDFKRLVRCWAYLDDLLDMEQKLSKTIKTLQKIAWSNSTDRYWKADYAIQVDWCKTIANNTLKEINGEQDEEIL